MVSTDCPVVAEIASQSSKARVHIREDSLCRSETSTDELIAHAVDLIPEGDILWTHVTSPFVDGRLYDEMISMNRSLMAVTPMRGFLWKNGPLNYSRKPEKWPRTQTIEPVYEINSAAFIASADTYREGDRVEENPYLFELGPITGMDIDWVSDFVLAECAFANNLR
jgi:CMP-N-acetylneuraminic acid synthetase